MKNRKITTILIVVSIITISLIGLYFFINIFNDPMHKVIDASLKIIGPFIASIFLFYLFSPIVYKLIDRMPNHKKISIAISLSLITFIFSCLLIGIGLFVGQQISVLYHDVVGHNIFVDLEYFLADKFNLNVNLSAVEIEIGKILSSINYVNIITSILSNALHFGISLVLTVVFLAAMLYDKDAIIRGISIILPNHFEKHYNQVINRSDKTIRAYFKGRIFSMLLLGMMMFFILIPIIVDFNAGWKDVTTRIMLCALFGIIFASLDIVPYIGPFIAAFIPMIYVALNPPYNPELWWMFPIIILIVQTIVQQIQENVVIPKICGEQMQIPGIVIIVSMLFFGDLFGFWGIILSVPIAGIIKETWVYFKEIKLVEKIIENIFDKDENIQSIKNEVTETKKIKSSKSKKMEV